MDSKVNAYYEIFKTVRTIEEQALLLNNIDSLIKLFYQNHPVAEETLVKLFGQNTGSIISNNLKKLAIEFADSAKMKDFFHELSEYAGTAEIIRATLALPADDQIKDVLGDWLQKTFPGKPVVIELDHNVGIVAGMQIAYKGKYWDYSLQNQVTKVFREKRDELFKPVHSG